MNNIENSNETSPKRRKLTLKDYYRELPKSISPKTEFCKKVAKECGVTFTTVRNWVHYGVRPKDDRMAKKIAEITGIPEEELFDY